MLDLDREQHLLDLAGELLFAGEQAKRARQLLRDGGGALRPFPREKVAQRGAHDPLRVDAGVAVEVGVLDGDHGVAEDLGDLLAADGVTPLGGERAEDRTIAGQHSRGCGRPVCHERLDGRELHETRKHETDHGPDPDTDEGSHQEPPQQSSAHPAELERPPGRLSRSVARCRRRRTSGCVALAGSDLT